MSSQPEVRAKTINLAARIEHWPIAGSFTLSRGSKTQAVVVTVELNDGQYKGRGESVPYARYDEAPEKVLTAIQSLNAEIANGLDRKALQKFLPAGAARNALDCAFWDLEAKESGHTIYELTKTPSPQPQLTAYTISLGTPEAMAEATAKVAHRPLLKIKLGTANDRDRLLAVRKAAPETELIIDANEGWKPETLTANLAACKEVGVTLIEQPLPAADDAALATISHEIAICADESARDTASLTTLKGKYDAVNVKLDKCGGLTEALRFVEETKKMGFQLMVGCMVSTSLAVAPAFLLTSQARFVDLDGPLLLAKDRAHGLSYDGALVYPPSSALWG